MLGAGIAVDDVKFTTGVAGASVLATLLVEWRAESIEVRGSDVVARYRPLIERAAEIRLGPASWRMIGPV